MKHSTIGSGLVVALALVVVTAPLAGAGVTVSSDSTAKGTGASLTFRVPNERDEASTTAVEVDFPTDHPLTGVSVLSKPGWTFSLVQAEPAATTSPTVTAVPTAAATPSSAPTPSVMVTSITWHIDSAVSAIPPGGYDLFTVAVPRLPTDTDALTFKAVQTYSSGEVVRWIDGPGTAEPAHAAPVLHLTGATPSVTPTPAPTMSTPSGGMTMTSTPMAGGMSMDMGPSRDDTVNVALGLGIAGLFLGLVAGTLGGAALMRSRSPKSAD